MKLKAEKVIEDLLDASTMCDGCYGAEEGTDECPTCAWFIAKCRATNYLLFEKMKREGFSR